MSDNFVAEASIHINAPVKQVWDALIDPAKIKQFMFDTEVVTDWTVGSPIIWQGVWNGKPYEDKGVILKFEPEHLLECTHYSPLSGEADVPENYHTLTYEVSEEDSGTLLVLSQDGNKTEEEKEHAAGMWKSMLEGVKNVVEKEV